MVYVFVLNTQPIPSKVNGQAVAEQTNQINVFIYHLIASFSSRLQVRLDVAWIQVSNAHQKPWSSEGPEFTETEYLNRMTAQL